MTKAEAIELGRRDGIGDVEQVRELQGRDVVIATLRPGHLGWDEDAINPGAHKVAGVPEEHREVCEGGAGAGGGDPGRAVEHAGTLTA